MKKTLRLIAMALMAGVMFAACTDGGDEDGKKPGNEEEEEVFPDVTITTATSGSIKAGVESSVVITGDGFDEVMDLIVIGYKDEFGETKFVELDNTESMIKERRIQAGVPIDAPFMEQENPKVIFYLDRPTFSKMPLTKELTITFPEVADGYIPDPAFRAQLKNMNNKVVFNSLGLLDVTVAKSLKTCSDNQDMHYGLNLFGCQATSLEGIELFESVEGLVVGWAGSMSKIKKIDFSKWEAKGIDIRIQDSPLLEEIIGSPYCSQILASGCPNLKKVDVHLCRGLRNLNISGKGSGDFDPNAPQGSVMFLDMRKEQGGWARDEANGGFVDANAQSGIYVTTKDQHTTYGSVSAKLADGAEVWVDSWWVADHSGWEDIYNGWKNNGVTVKVFARYDPQFSENMLLGTIPTYEQAPDALSSSSVSLGSNAPANKWIFDDPSTPLTDESHATNGGIPWNPIPGPGIDAVGTL